MRSRRAPSPGWGDLAALDARRPARTDPPAIGGARIPSAHVDPARDWAANRVRIGTMYPPPND